MIDIWLFTLSLTQGTITAETRGQESKTREAEFGQTETRPRSPCKFELVV